MVNFRKLLSNKGLILGAIVVVIAIVLFSYDGSKRSFRSGFTGGEVAPYGGPVDIQSAAPGAFAPQDTSEEMTSPMSTVSDPTNLLPSDSNSAWAALNPSVDVGATPDLLQSGQLYGVGTNYKRNANIQLRADPVIIQKNDNISPWQISPIEPSHYNYGIHENL